MNDPEPDPDDPLWKFLNEQYGNILYLYQQYAAQRPVMLFDVQEQRVYAYPCRGFAADLSKKSQASLRLQYRAALAEGHMVVFIRDNEERRLVSYSVPIGKTRTKRHATKSKIQN